MADFKISRSGTLVGLAIAPLSLQSDDAISTVTEVSATTGLTVTNETKNSSSVTFGGTTYTANRCITFDLAASSTCEIHAKHKIVFSYTTTGGETLRVEATVEVVAALT